MKEEFLCPLLCATVDRIGFCLSISLIYIAHVAVIFRHNLRLYGFPIIIAEITLCWWIMYVFQKTYVPFVPPQYGCKLTPSLYLKFAPLECHSLGAQYLWHALPVGADSATTVNLFRGQVVE